jgi:hypothetical protein
MDRNEEPILNEERTPATDRDERMRQSAGVTDTQQRPARGNERKIGAGDGAGDQPPSAKRELDSDAGRTDVGGPVRAPETRPADEADARAGGRWFGEKGTPSADPPLADNAARSGEAEALEPLFTPELAETYRLRWTSIQSGFVDDPRQAVRSGDELVAQIMTNLADSFAEERHRVEAQLDSSGEGSTEELRVTLRRYRSFFERLLSL